ncbi:MAG: alpha/beta fold hydrolase [Lautropia sp.]|nr:alpha/beta fold hydrolase [Lautropia sp.]
MVEAQYRLVKEHLGLKHVRLVMGNSMGGMQVWLWGIKYPDYMDALVPMASLPGPMSGRNWMMRRMLVDSVLNDPAWNNGNYTQQPPNLRVATFWFATATSGGNQRLQKLGPTGKEADAYVDKQLAAQKVGDANDVMYQWASSRDFDPRADLGKIGARLLDSSAIMLHPLLELELPNQDAGPIHEVRADILRLLKRAAGDQSLAL